MKVYSHIATKLEVFHAQQVANLETPGTRPTSVSITYGKSPSIKPSKQSLLTRHEEVLV